MAKFFLQVFQMKSSTTKLSSHSGEISEILKSKEGGWRDEFTLQNMAQVR